VLHAHFALLSAPLVSFPPTYVEKYDIHRSIGNRAVIPLHCGSPLQPCSPRGVFTALITVGALPSESPNLPAPFQPCNHVPCHGRPSSPAFLHFSPPRALLVASHMVVRRRTAPILYLLSHRLTCIFINFHLSAEPYQLCPDV
jgi:hypothetical protein